VVEYLRVFRHVGFFYFRRCSTSATKTGNPVFEMTLRPALSEEEHEAIDHSARMLREAANTIAYTETSTAAARETQEVR
jgi:hypothetical protein